MKQKNKTIPEPLDAETSENPIGYPATPVGDDIYNKYQEEKDIDPEDISRLKEINAPDSNNKNLLLTYDKNKTGDDLDVPGAELDDELEKVGSEDEENNYYSIGGDDHTDLDEFKEE